VLLASLWWLEQHEGAPTQARLAEHAAIDAMMTSQVVRRLEGRDLLARAADTGDARVRRLAMTAQGSSVIARALPAVEAADQEYFQALGRRQAAFTKDLLTLSRRVDDRSR
jgi:DNA-binding MarR family transcriptional regulator